VTGGVIHGYVLLDVNGFDAWYLIRAQVLLSSTCSRIVTPLLLENNYEISTIITFYIYS
jgi:hypothetical protein